MDLPSKNTEITLWQLHIKCIYYKFLKKKPMWTHTSFYCMYGLLEIIQDTEIFKTQILLNKSITVYFGVTIYSL